MTENEIGQIVLSRAIRLHRDLGPGLLESVYELLLADDLKRQGLSVEQQMPVPLEYNGRRFEPGFRADILVENEVILELKSVEAVSNAHKKQLLTYLRLSGLRLGFLLNFGAAMLKDGITRTVNGLHP